MHRGVSTWWTWSITFNFKSRIRFMLFPGLLLNKTTAKMCFLELHVIVLTVKFFISCLTWLCPLPTSKHSSRRCKAWFRVGSLDKGKLSFIWHRSPVPGHFVPSNAYDCPCEIAMKTSFGWAVHSFQSISGPLKWKKKKKEPNKTKPTKNTLFSY